MDPMQTNVDQDQAVWGGGSVSLERRATWLLRFAASDLKILSTAKWKTLKREAATYGARWPTRRPRKGRYVRSLPTQREIWEGWAWLQDLLFDLREERSWMDNSPLAGVTVAFDMTEKSLEGGIVPWEDEWPAMFKAQTICILSRPEIQSRFRFCPACQRPFLVRGRQQYCQSSCSQKTRTRKYRTLHREHFKELRRKYYARAVRRRLGEKVKIGTRRRRVGDALRR